MNVELARRAVACKHWRWMSGMLAEDEHGQRERVAEVMLGREGSEILTIAEAEAVYIGTGEYLADLIDMPAHKFVPVLDDPATLGCLLHILRGLWGNGFASYQIREGYWIASGSELSYHTQTPFPESEAEALVRALEAAP